MVDKDEYAALTQKVTEMPTCLPYFPIDYSQKLTLFPNVSSR